MPKTIKTFSPAGQETVETVRQAALSSPESEGTIAGGPRLAMPPGSERVTAGTRPEEKHALPISVTPPGSKRITTRTHLEERRALPISVMPPLHLVRNKGGKPLAPIGYRPGLQEAFKTVAVPAHDALVSGFGLHPAYDGHAGTQARSVPHMVLRTLAGKAQTPGETGRITIQQATFPPPTFQLSALKALMLKVPVFPRSTLHAATLQRGLQASPSLYRPSPGLPPETDTGQEIGPGRPLAPGPRRMMERFWGTDFGHVRVHTEPSAARMASALKAQAFTIGRHIFFADGKARFHTPAGIGLLGHELTHVRQHWSIPRPVSSSLLQAQAEEEEALANQAVLQYAYSISIDRPLAPWPLRPAAQTTQPEGITVAQASPSPGVSRAPEAARRAASAPTPVSMPLLLGVPVMELAKPLRKAAAEAPAAAPTAEAPSPGKKEEKLDLDALARQVYDLIMRRLSLERERTGHY